MTSRDHSLLHLFHLIHNPFDLFGTYCVFRIGISAGRACLRFLFQLAFYLVSDYIFSIPCGTSVSHRVWIWGNRICRVKHVVWRVFQFNGHPAILYKLPHNCIVITRISVLGIKGARKCKSIRKVNAWKLLISLSVLFFDAFYLDVLVYGSHIRGQKITV